MTYPSNGSTPDYAELWQEELNELNDPNISATVKLETFFTQGVEILMGFYEQQMNDCAGLMNSLSQLETDTSSMQADFDEGDEYSKKIDQDQTDIQNDATQYAATGQQSYMDDMNTKEADMATQMTAYQATVADAMQKAADIQNILNSNPTAFGAISDDVNAQLQILFPYGTDSSDPTAVTNNCNSWLSIWTDTNNPTSDSSTSADMTGITNAFNALNTDFSGLSSEFQSQLQFYEGEDQQMQGLDEDCMQEWAKSLNTMQTNQITS